MSFSRFFRTYSQPLPEVFRFRAKSGENVLHGLVLWKPLFQHRSMQHAVVTGGTGGLGSAIAARLRSDGWTVEAPGRDVLDVANRSAIHAYFDGRPVDLLVCCAGIVRDAPLARLPGPVWDEIFRVNYSASEACARAVIESWHRERRSGHVVFISSFSALHPPSGQAAYATAKAALLGLTRGLAMECGPHDIRVNAILPGFLETPMTAKVSPGRRREVLDAHALQRFNTPETVAGFICFLHEELPHTSGQIFQLDSRPGG